ncbi:MAG: polyribonucleotide nucleotidyltransferase [Chloroflexi bacterium]|nr:polyribonucleotide nucleotidyltransferase [Chloroflexota bacterium]MCI0577882.1 polyribonucleotide nucleotidyltransferase [Chloroflexota bacterium]MCI0644482.1 polyribonucleotide nucleotidyltransferase [Chloroflexota bacterium]MCI0730250.1 polyribonucleotide nucleotidyltransferase [Chloroflexota bacterium]
MFEEKSFSTKIGGHEFIVSTGKLAEQAGGAVTVRVGDSMLLATATMAKTIREGLDFFPLSVDFEEKMYAAGRIPGSFFRREGRPSTDAILICRLTDRPLRPLFPEGMRNEVQIIITTLSSDSEHHLDIMSVNAASIALMVSDIPWNGPIGAVRVGYIDGQFVVNPTIPQMVDSLLDLRIAGTRDAIIMVEAGAKEASEALVIEALEFGHRELQPLIDLQLEMQAAVGKPKREIIVEETDQILAETVRLRLGDKVHKIVEETDEREERNEALDELREATVDEILEIDETTDPKDIREVIAEELKKAVRERILYEGVRPDGRGYSDIRELKSDVGISPRAHGSGLFQRGQTQVLAIVALGTPREAQKLDGLYPEDTRRFIHHYNFPPYSTGETWMLRGPKRREIGHGALVETALEPMIPPEDEFPYTIRVVSEVLSSNGSTSQASVCSSSLALMDCGVPIKRTVAGVAMGLVTDGNKYAVLTDIQGIEDHLGDMDFKVAGTGEGITALQMDIKISGLSKEVMAEALEQARVARLQILDHMAQTMPEPRQELSKWAPRMITIKIDPDKIGAVIGKGGSTIRSIEEDYDVSIDIQDDGTVYVAGLDGERADAALSKIEALTREPEMGQIFTGKVVRTTDFGAFVEFTPGVDGMVHISQLSSERLNRVEDAVTIGDEIMVMITDVDKDTGKIRLSRQAVLEGWSLEEARANDVVRSSRGNGGGRDRRGGDRDRRGGGGPRR